MPPIFDFVPASPTKGQTLRRAYAAYSDSYEGASPVDPIQSEEMPEQPEQPAIEVGQEVEWFARGLDNCILSRASPSDQRAQIFNLVDSYYDYASQKVDNLRQRRTLYNSARGRRQRASSEDHSGNEMEVDDAEVDSPLPGGDEELRKWEHETQTWDLLRRLLPLRFPDRPSSSTAVEGENPDYWSRRSYWDAFLRTDSLAEERQTILDWLQANARNRPDINDLVKDLQLKADRGENVTNGWLYTQGKIKQQKRIHGLSSAFDPGAGAAAGSHMASTGAPLVTQLDPDAMTRQGRKLEPQDEYFERAIWVGCFELLRRGCGISDIRDWCDERTEVWRAVSMSSLPLSSDETEDISSYDPDSALLWRRVCLALAREGGTDEHERAVYGLLAGDVKSVERVCRTWDDYMFARYNALVRTQFDNFLINHVGPTRASAICQPFPGPSAIQYHGDAASVGAQLVSSLESNLRTQAEANTPTKALQGAFLSHGFGQYIYQQGLFLSQMANSTDDSKLLPDFGGISVPIRDTTKFVQLGDHNGIRLLAHILIVVSALECLSTTASDLESLSSQGVRTQVQENVIAAYVSFLRLGRLEELIPLYCARLKGPRLYHTLSKNLIHIIDPDGRVTQLNLMRKLGLDVSMFLTSQPDILFDEIKEIEVLAVEMEEFKILESSPPTLKFGRHIKPDFFGDDPDRIDRMDELLIRSVEWLLLVDGLLVETFSIGTRVYKYFLGNLHLNAARAFSVRVPCAEIIRKKTDISPRDDLGPAWFEELGAKTTTNTGMAGDGVAGKDQVLVWARTFWEMECLVRALDSMETISSMAEITREDSSVRRDLFTKVGDEIKAAKAYMRPLLKSWLLESNEEDEDLAKLRQKYLPETVLAYVSALHFAGTCWLRDNLLECMELAAVIADKGSDVAAIFIQTGRMKELVEAFASCSKALAIWTGEKKGPQSSSKKLREMGWSKELWSIKQ